MKQILLLLLLFVSQSFYAQTIEILEKGDTLQKAKYQQFIYLADSTNTTSATFVAKIKLRGSLKNTSNLYYYIKNKAQSWGANGFKFESFTKTDAENGELVLSTFFCEDSLFDANFENMPKDKIFIFGNDDLTENKVQGYKVNGQKLEISSGKFKVISIGENDEIKITKGGFTGMTVWLKRKEYGFSSYLSFSGLGLNNASYAPGYNGVGVSFNTGKINQIEANLALVLLKMFQEQP